MKNRSRRTGSAGTRFAAALALAVGAVAGVPTAAHATPGTTGLIATVWTCTNNDTTTFLLPAAAVSPSAGAVVAPFPGFLTAVEGPTLMPLGTYIVTGVAQPGPLPASLGRKTGVVAHGAVDCTLEGTDLTVTIAAA